LEVQIEVPIDSNTFLLPTLTSDALIIWADTTPDLSKPLAMASAIIPAPINPTRVFAVTKSVAIATAVATLTNRRRLCIPPHNNNVNPQTSNHHRSPKILFSMQQTTEERKHEDRK